MNIIQTTPHKPEVALSWIAHTKSASYRRGANEFAKDFSPWDVNGFEVDCRYMNIARRSFFARWQDNKCCFVNVESQSGVMNLMVSVNGVEDTASRIVYFNRAEVNLGHLYVACGFKYHLANDVYLQVLLKYGASTGFSVDPKFIATAKNYPSGFSQNVSITTKIMTGPKGVENKIEIPRELTQTCHNYSNSEIDLSDPSQESMELWK